MFLILKFNFLQRKIFLQNGNDQDEGTFHLKPPGRRILLAMGSTEMSRVGWRDMWAMVAIKGVGKVAEGYTKSPDSSEVPPSPQSSPRLR